MFTRRTLSSSICTHRARFQDVGSSRYRDPNPCCEGIDAFRRNLKFDVGAISLAVTDVESCTGFAPGHACPWRFTSFDPRKNYLKVAVRFNILHANLGGVMMNWQPPLPCRAEGVYEPWTGEMHLVANVQLAKEDAGDDGRNNNLIEPMIIHQPGPPQVYVKIQYAPMNSTAGAAHPLQFHMESLRSPSDPLYFSPLQFQGPQFLSPPKVVSSCFRDDRRRSSSKMVRIRASA